MTSYTSQNVETLHIYVRKLDNKPGSILVWSKDYYAGSKVYIQAFW